MSRAVHRAGTAGAFALTLAGLTACGNGSSDPENRIYDFHPETTVTSVPEALVVTPDELIELDENYYAHRVLDHVEIVPTQGGDGLCAMDLRFALTPDATAAIEEGRWEGIEQTSTENGDIGDLTWREIPTQERYLAALGFESPEVTVETACATDANDDSAAVGLVFTELSESSSEYPFSDEEYDYLDEQAQAEADIQFDGKPRWEVLDAFAEVSVNVTETGEISVVDSTVKGYEYAGNSWQPTQ